MASSRTNQGELDVDLFSSEDWETAFANADKEEAKVIVANLVNKTNTAVYLPSLDGIEDGHNKEGKLKRKVRKENQTSEDNPASSPIAGKKTRPTLIRDQPSKVVALVEITRVIGQKKATGSPTVATTWKRTEETIRLERLEEEGCTLTTQGESRADIMTIVNKFAMQSNRAVVVEKETQRDKKKGLIKHTFLFAQLLNPTYSDKASRPVVPSTLLKATRNADPVESSNTLLGQGIKAKFVGSIINEKAGAATGKQYATERTGEMETMHSTGLQDNIITPGTEAFDCKLGGFEDMTKGREKKGDEPVELQSSEETTVDGGVVNNGHVEPVLNTPEASHGTTQPGLPLSLGGEEEEPAPKSRASLHANFPRLPQGTWTLFRDESDKPQSLIKRFLHPMLNEEAEASGE
jgi:hypothetical protein